MKKIVGFICALGLVFGMAGVSTAGLLVDSEGSCNDYFLTTAAAEGVYNVYGYEYGCNATGRLASGAGVLAGGIVYLGFTGTTGNSPNQLAMRNHIIDLSTLDGTYEYLYVSSGNIFGGSGTVSLSFGPKPTAAVNTDGADESLQ